jgi:hypothetical protein
MMSLPASAPAAPITQVPQHECQKAGTMQVLLRTLAGVFARFPAKTAVGPEFFICVRVPVSAKRHNQSTVRAPENVQP